MLIVGAGIALYRLLAMRAAVKLEGKGLRVRQTRLGSVTAQAKRELGLGRGASRAAVLEALARAIAAQEARLAPGDITE